MFSSNKHLAIKLRGVWQNNLKGFDLDLPLNSLIVITGPSGSGKSSLAFDTLYAEGQRRYIETFSPYARQFFDRMDKPRVDSIEMIPPAIAIEQKNTVRTTRSTVGTLTEICDYMKVIWGTITRLYCRGCGKWVRRDSPEDIWKRLNSEFLNTVSSKTDTPPEIIVVFELPLVEKVSILESLQLITRQGYQRILYKDKVCRIEEVSNELSQTKIDKITVVQDRIHITEESRSRFIDACEQAYHFGKGNLAIYFLADSQPAACISGEPIRFSNRLHCARCNIEYAEPSQALFSFNHPLGACPKCHGFGRIIGIDYDLVIPNKNLSLAQGAIRPWQTGFSRECYDDLMKFCKKRGVPVDVPFKKLSSEHQKWVIEGDPDYGKDSAHTWPHYWYGVKGYFDWLEERTYKMHVRVLLSRYRRYTKCPECNGGRFQKDSLLFKLPITEELQKTLPAQLLQKIPVDELTGEQTITLADLYGLPINDSYILISAVVEVYKNAIPTPILTALNEVKSRLEYLVRIGLGYLTLDRQTRTLSGGEIERVNLTACLGSRLVNTLYILDEPTVGLHTRDTERLVNILKELKNIGNTVVVVEHEPAVMRAADYIVDLGPGSGESGGKLVFFGTYANLLKHTESLTAQYLSGRKKIHLPLRRPVKGNKSGKWLCRSLEASNLNRNNLKNITVTIPLGRLVCITGVSGSGKSTLLKECLYPTLLRALGNGSVSSSGSLAQRPESSGNDTEDENLCAESEIVIKGVEFVSDVLLVDQSPPGKTPRSNPVIYVDAFDHIRELFAESEEVRRSGLTKGDFSFNSAQGRCGRCGGSGFEKIEMQFLSDVYIRCPECNGTRFKKHVADIKISPDSLRRGGIEIKSDVKSTLHKSIVDVLQSTIDDLVKWLELFPDSAHAIAAIRKLRALQKVGLGYLKAGQPINTLSGGECQRLKLARCLAEIANSTKNLNKSSKDADEKSQAPQRQDKSILFLFDEPTTGLHFCDIALLIKTFHELVDQGHSVVIIEHNLEVIKCADWIIDLGPEAGEGGGDIVAVGTPEEIAKVQSSYTGQALAQLLCR